MENLKIEKTNTTPRIDFDAKLHTLSISGEIYPENVEASLELFSSQYYDTNLCMIALVANRVNP